MDLTVLDKKDISSLIKLEYLKNVRLQQNRGIDVIKIMIFYGNKGGRQYNAVYNASQDAKANFKKLYNVNIEIEEIFSDNIFFDSDKWWDPWELFKRMETSDIHIIPTHGHQANIGRIGGGKDNWTVDAYLRGLNLMEYHLGYPMGLHIKCPVFTQHKVIFTYVIQFIIYYSYLKYLCLVWILWQVDRLLHSYIMHSIP